MDVNVRAFRVVQAALSAPVTPDKRKESARKGGLAGGPSRARSISAARRTEIAIKASSVRWGRSPDTGPVAASSVTVTK
jgi:hypothetical protein